MAKYVKTEDGYQKIEVINSNKMDKDNPVGTGSFSMGRKAGTTVGSNSHAEGSSTTASGKYSHAEGYNTTASDYASHAEGYNTTASDWYSHTEGYNTTASGYASHAEGSYTTASGYASHTEGYNTTASGYASHAEGCNTEAYNKCQHVQGEYNIIDTTGNLSSRGTCAHIIGNGTSDSARSNAHTLDWSGNAWFAGDVYTGSTSGTNKDAGSKKLATEEYVNNSIPTKTSDLTNDSSFLTDSSEVVKYISQTLTDEQKIQARTNIGAGTSDFSGSYNDLRDKPVELVLTDRTTGINYTLYIDNGKLTMEAVSAESEG